MVKHFRPRRLGPEAKIEDAVASQRQVLFPQTQWAGASVPVGAGAPDLIFAHCKPAISAFSNCRQPDLQILEYLHAVRWVSAQTIARKTRQSRDTVVRNLNNLIAVRAVLETSDSYKLSNDCRHALAEVVTVEAKVSNWNRAVQQASRNSIFCHRSFVALPDRLATRIQDKPIFEETGIGIISVSDDNQARVLRDSTIFRPKVWSYYYYLTFLAAKDL